MSAGVSSEVKERWSRYFFRCILLWFCVLSSRGNAVTHAHGADKQNLSFDVPQNTEHDESPL